MVYVIGMNYNSINPLIRSKYGESLIVNGFDYMQKIVQLPFQIQMWNKDDIKKLIDNTLAKNFANTDLLVRGVKWNPREVKRIY
jgi:predicted KAP-like P-loop ATPase